MGEASDELLRVLADAREEEYIGEPISQLSHAMQCAALAERAGKDDAFVVAALLHDIGHLIAADDAPRMGGVGVLRHEQIGADHLRMLGLEERAVELVRGHVDAKRYLVRRRPGYEARLSAASKETLSHQGGAMSEEEAESFERHPLFKELLELRAFDEAAKEVDAETNDLQRYRSLIQKIATGG